MSSLRQAGLARIGNTVGELFVIANGETDSNAVDWAHFSDAEAFSITSPAGLSETVQIQIDSGGDGTFHTLLDSTNTAVKVPTDGASQVYNGVITACVRWRLHATGAVGAARNFIVKKAFRT